MADMRILDGTAISNVSWIEHLNSTIANDAIEKNIGMPMFKRLEINITDLCNRRCHFCPRNDSDIYPNTKLHFDRGMFENICDQLRDMEWSGGIVFSAFGEPLLHPEILEFIDILKTRLPAVILEIVTNGDRAKKPLVSQLFATGLDILKVSLYDGPQQLKKFEELRRSLNLTDKKMVLRPRYEYHEAQDLILSNRAGTVSSEGAEEPTVPVQPCTFIFYKMVIDADGTSLLCSHDWTKSVSGGNLTTNSLVECWKSENFQKVRQQLILGKRNHSPCKNCNVDGMLNGVKEMMRWSEILNGSS